MASKAGSRQSGWAEALLRRPVGAAELALVSGVIVVVGAVYCSGYEALTSGLDNWPASLLWAAYALLPWYLLFEAIKRLEHRRGERLPALVVAVLVVMVGAFSLVAEQADYRLSGSVAPPLLLSLLRRTPGIAVALALILVSRHFRERTPRSARPPAEPVDLAQVAGIRWIGAADNYLELHFAEGVKTIRMTMHEAERQLAGRGFVRIHRSIIVNRSLVKSIEPGERGDTVRLVDGTVLQAGKAFAVNLRSLA